MLNSCKYVCKSRFIISYFKRTQEVLCKKRSFRNFTKFTRKHLCQSLFLNKIVGLAYNFIKKEILAQVVPVNFAKFLKKPFLQSSSGRLLLFCVSWINQVYKFWSHINLFVILYHPCYVSLPRQGIIYSQMWARNLFESCMFSPVSWAVPTRVLRQVVLTDAIFRRAGLWKSIADILGTGSDVFIYI